MKSPYDTFGNQTLEIPACNTVPQPSAPFQKWFIPLQISISSKILNTLKPSSYVTELRQTLV
jgi:hypothetical protein